MSKGIGIDIVDISRIGSIVSRYGRHFLEKVFTSDEIKYCSEHVHPEVHYAGRWAVKEAFFKALPSCIQQYSMWKSIQVLSAKPSGKPEITILSEVLKEKMQEAGITQALLSISHEKSYCVAVVVME